MLQDLQRSGRHKIIINETVEAVRECNTRGSRKYIRRTKKIIILPYSTVHTTLLKQLYLYVRESSNRAESLKQKDYQCRADDYT